MEAKVSLEKTLAIIGFGDPREGCGEHLSKAPDRPAAAVWLRLSQRINPHR